MTDRANHDKGQPVRTIVSLLLIVTIATADPRPGDVGTPEHEKATALVKQLGDKRFATRRPVRNHDHVHQTFGEP